MRQDIPRTIFFGSPRFAQIVLENLVAAYCDPIAVVTNPDRPAGRRQILTPPAVKHFILSHPESLHGHIHLLQPESITPALESELKQFNPDLLVVAAYAKILPASLLSIARLGAIGVHPSLLPLYRGASPIQNAILDGAEETGVSLYLMDEKMDHGPVIAQNKFALKDINYLKAEESLATLGGLMLAEIMPRVLTEKIKATPQNESHATFTKKIKTEDGFIPLPTLQSALGGDKQNAALIYRKIMALNPEPGVYTITSDTTRVKLLDARLEKNHLKLVTIQPEGKMPTQGFSLALFNIMN